ncbi:polysaccharide deacetylase (plasmid) [Bacillus sp. JAS24-2]|uniref:peptidoglycan-N-acetylglucosamine deacetylase n=1 Tax=Bacillus sp. JAS24-2 TaxID=2217832 RepID=UPI0011F02477|nr:polysaccharide deacetylase family protein [Bacillus sp. JAS24-2]QEL82862.1 polysaccharide deacetylase [Bacillus sp. JAS24-2]
MKNIRNIKRIVVTIIAIIIGCIVFKTFTSSTKSITKQEKPVQQVAEQNKIQNNKSVPQKFNGQTRKIVYLTFDDGPGKYTAKLLDILKKNQVKASFFLIGGNVTKFPDLVKQEKAEGDYIGLHSMTHDYKKLYTNGQYVKEMKEVQSLVKNVIGDSPTLTRPPYGSMPGLNEELRNKVVEEGFKVWDWTIDSLDWKYNKLPIETASNKIIQNVLSNAKHSKEIILLHDIHPQSIAAVPAIIEGLKAKGYEFEVYSEANHFPLNFWHDKRI